jgi:hypothetical protein
MKKLTVLLAILSLAVTGPVFAQSSIAYTLGLGGDNDAAGYEADPAFFPQFDTTVGTYTEADDLVWDESTDGTELTWSVKVGVSGVHSGGDSDGLAPNGAANLVFDLDLRTVAGGTLAAGVDFYSSIMDGDADGARGGSQGADPLHWANFAMIYDLNAAGVTDAGRGRIIDLLADGGPGLAREQYPSKKGTDNTSEPSAASAPDATLLGMGCGYPEYEGAMCITGLFGCEGDYFFGVGMDSAGGYDLTSPDFVMGEVPVFEGQMDLSGLDAGTYELTLYASADSSNILDGDFDPDAATPGDFASPVNGVVVDSIVFEWVPGGNEPPPVVATMESVKTHGSCGDWGFDMLAGTKTDSRYWGTSTNDNVVITFDDGAGTPVNVAAADGSLDVTVEPDTSGEIVMNQGSGSASISGDTITVSTSGITNATCLTVTVQNIANAADSNAVMTSAETGRIACLAADAYEDHAITATDLAYIKYFSGQPVTDYITARCDVYCDGVVGSTDIAYAKYFSGTSASCP